MRAAVSLFITILCICMGAFAEDSASSESLLNKLLAPGPLIEGHKKLEKIDCLECHDAGKGVPNSKCLACHKEIKKSVDFKSGYHGLQKGQCIKCHKDHKGRDFDAVHLDEKAFDHKLTGFSLKGGHEKIKCSKCHTEKRSKKTNRKTDIRYFGETKTCYSCHKKDDIHYYKGNWAKKDCNECHNDSSWDKNTKFDHAKDTGYKLVEAHKKAKCTDCHKINKVAKTAKYKWHNLKRAQCLSCHKDPHKRNLSKKYRSGKCTTCHTQKTWKLKAFDHSKVGYKLKGEHAKIKCIDCHKQSKKLRNSKQVHYKWKGLTEDCMSCHKDYHRFDKYKYKYKPKKFKNLNNCISCHNEKSWKSTHNFYHNRDTKYKIEGKHKKLKCNECHIQGKKIKKSIYHWKQLKTKTCETCHKSPHKNEFSKKFLKKKCTECHIAEGWKYSLKDKGSLFKHDETRFKLTGKHKKVSCKECHGTGKKQKFIFKSFQDNFCIDCHKNEHVKQFSKKFSSQSCAECHNTKKFTTLKKFKHEDTAFKLNGKHKKLKCNDCHTRDKRKGRYSRKPKRIKRKYVFKNLAKDNCVTCHKDFHRGQLGNKCSDCHSEKKWSKSLFVHNKMSDYKLKGKHKKLKCSECHKPIKRKYVKFKKKRYKVIHYKPIKDQCVDCHKDPHRGVLGSSCNECHSEKSWKRTKDYHKNFTLHGSHFTANCTECHVDNRNLGGLSDNCILCHQKDDVHNGSLPNCAECHKQHFWEDTKFRHSMTSFPLRGIHRSLECNVCHQSGDYIGNQSGKLMGSFYSGECVDCHQGDIVNPVHFDHNAVVPLPDCNECHNHFTFDKGL